MRRTLLLSFIIFPLFNSFAQPSEDIINIFLETSVFNDHKIYFSDSARTFTTNTNFNAGIEIILSKNSQSPIKFGTGAIYQFPTQIIGRKGDYTFLPIYGFIRIYFIETDYFNTSVQMRLGYNFFFNDGNYLENKKAELGNGLYFSLGSIINVSDFQVRMFYSINYGKYKSEAVDYLITNNQFSTGIGLLF